MRAPDLAPLLAFAALAGCVSAPAPAPQIASAPLPPPATAAEFGLESVIGSPAPLLIAQFGQPDLDLDEGEARKLQFLGAVCVLDAYLYAPREGREPVVAHVDARLPDGREMDRSSCVAALTRRAEAR